MRKSEAGVTLLELMIVVVIVGILATIAYPSYRQYAMRAKRADAKIALQQSAQALENCFTRFHVYNDTTNCTIANSLAGSGVPSPDRNYTITATGTNLAALSFNLTAAPQGGQTADTGCGSFTLTESNLRGVSASTAQAVVAECWK